MIGGLFRKQSSEALSKSRLFDQSQFYQAFARDLGRCRKEIVIESPFITIKRTATLLPIFRTLERRGVKVVLNTRDPREHDSFMRTEADGALAMLREFGVRILLTGGHHRKLAVLDRKVLWEGSLNILSHADSCEIMRRIESPTLANEMLSFTRIKSHLS